MTIAFECPDCSRRVTAINDHAGLATECPNCARHLVIPTTIQRANQIVARMCDILCAGGSMQYTALSKVGASTRMEALRALRIAIAETFTLQRTPANTKILDDFVRGAGGTSVWVIYYFFPDAELEVIAKLPQGLDLRNDLSSLGKHIEESQRLEKLALSDTETAHSETIDSFVSFIRTLNPAGRDYWSLVYQRIGLSCPLADEAREVVPLPQPEKSWWQKLFGGCVPRVSGLVCVERATSAVLLGERDAMKDFWNSLLGKLIRWLVFIPIGVVCVTLLDAIPRYVFAVGNQFHPLNSWWTLIVGLFVLSIALTVATFWAIGAVQSAVLSCAIVAPNNKVASVIFGTLFTISQAGTCLGNGEFTFTLNPTAPTFCLYDLLFSGLVLWGCVLAYKLDWKEEEALSEED